MISPSIKIYFFGDSISFGQYVDLCKTWAVDIARKLEGLSAELKHRLLVQNPSVNGNTTRQALERMPYDIQAHRPDILLVLFGLNDGNYWASDLGLPRVSPHAFSANMEEIITRGLTFGAKRVIVHTNHPTGRTRQILPHTRITYQQSVEQYNEIIREVVRRFDDRVVLNDIEQKFKRFTEGNPDRLLPMLLPEPDLLHLSEEGHRLYAAVTYPVIEEAVRVVVAQMRASIGGTLLA